MTATNHALTGALIGLSLGKPWLALPTAFFSHFICDIIPHFGKEGGEKFLRSRLFKNTLALDATLCTVVATILFVTHPLHWFLAIACAFLATSPDLYWVTNFRKALQGQKISYKNWFAHFAHVIQWFQKPIGIVVEAAWAIAMVVLIVPFIS